MFKVRMQGQYGSPGDKRLGTVVREMWAQWGFRKGVMRGYWVCVVASLMMIWLSIDRRLGFSGHCGA